MSGARVLRAEQKSGSLKPTGHLVDVYDEILDKRLSGKRLSLEEGTTLFSCDLLRLGKAADQLTRRVHAEPIVTYIVSRNISYTNVCDIDCDFCAFSCRKHAAQAYCLSLDQVLEKVRELADLGGTQAMIQGGINPEIPLDYYWGLIRSIRVKFPEVQVHSFSAVELDAFSKYFHLTVKELVGFFKNAGLNSVPGGGAEILVDRVRNLISPRKISAERWLEIMRSVHEAGLKSTATMVIGHVETVEERILHLIKIRELQDETGGFRAFIPWTMAHAGTPRMRHLKFAGGEDYLKTVAISRLMLDNIAHIQSGWLTEGLKLAQVALFFGCDDMGGTLIEDKVLEPTGIEVRTRRDDLIQLIRQAGFIPAERNTNYEILHVYN